MRCKAEVGRLVSLLNHHARFVYSPVIAKSLVMGDVV